MTYDIESIVIKVLANNSGNLVIPLKGYSTSGNTNCPYDWKISVDNGAEISYSGSGGGTLTIATGLVAGSEHLVIIKPATVDYQWARAFGTGEDATVGKYIIEVVQDMSYMGYGVSATNTGDYFRLSQYACSAVRIAADEGDIPDTVTTIGDEFMCAQFYDCSELVKAPKEGKIGTGVTTIGGDFRSWMFQNCYLLTDGVEEQELPNVSTIGDSFREGQYYNCSVLSMVYDEVLGENITSIGAGFRKSMFYNCSTLTTPAKEYVPDGLLTIGNNFRKNQYQASGVTITAKEVMPKLLQTIGTYARDYQYYNCLSLSNVAGETGINSGATIGTGYRRGQYYNCTSLQNARLSAFGGVTNYRQNCFYGITNPITITILGNIVDKPTSQGALSNTNVNKIYVDSNLVSSYKSSSSRSSINDDKFVEIPYGSFSADMLLKVNLRTDTLNVYNGKINTSLLKIVLDGTENWTENSGVFSFSVSGNTQKGYVLTTNGECNLNIDYDINQWYRDGGVCFNNNMGFTLASFKSWLAQEYTDGTPVIIIGLDQYTRENPTTSYNINTKDGENLIAITQGGPDVNDLQAQIVVEQATGGYTANVFNGEDYSVESDWIEISDQEVDKGGDVVGPNSSTDGNVVLFDGTTGKVIKDSGVNLSSKQDTLTAGNGIDITNNTVSTTYCYGESTTAAATVQKVVNIPSITELNVGQVIIVKPTVTSTVANSTLKLNNFDAYSMLYNGTAITTSTDSIVWGANVPSMFYLDEVSGTKYWRFLGHGLDSNSTYTLNQLLDAGRYKAGVGTYAITRYSLCMMKADGTWEKITATNANYSTGTTKNVNTNGFVLNQIKYYNTTTAVANGAFVGTNTFVSQAASVNLAYSFNCGTAPGWALGDVIYIVGTIGADGLFYLDTTTRWSNTLPTTNDGKLYIRIGTALDATNSTATFLQDRPIFYYDNGIKEYVGGYNKQDKSAMVTTLVGADNDHYPTAKAVTDAGYVTSSIIDDTAFAASWDGDTTHAPTKNAVYDKIDAMDTTIAGKQDELVSGTNIRTINGTSILGSGDITTPTGIPSQTGEAGKFLTTDGTYVSWGNAQAKHIATTATLSSASWTSHTQTVSVTGVTASNTVLVSPAPSSFADYTNAVIYCSAQASGTLTFTCTTDPTSNVTVNIIILD